MPWRRNRVGVVGRLPGPLLGGTQKRPAPRQSAWYAATPTAASASTMLEVSEQCEGDIEIGKSVACYTREERREDQTQDVRVPSTARRCRA